MAEIKTPNGLVIGLIVKPEKHDEQGESPVVKETKEESVAQKRAYRRRTDK